MLPFLEKAMAAPKAKKPTLNVVSMKKLVKTMEKLGKTVTHVEASPDGSIRVQIGDPAEDAGANPFDVVLK
jgi:hypothetical protein